MPSTELKKSLVHKLYKRAGLKKRKGKSELRALTNIYFRNIVYQTFVTRKMSTNKITLKDVDVDIVKYIRGE